MHGAATKLSKKKKMHGVPSLTKRFQNSIASCNSKIGCTGGA